MSYAIIRPAESSSASSRDRHSVFRRSWARPAGRSSSTTCFSAPTAKSVHTGVPALSGAKVTGEIVKHGRGDKIIVFKFKRRKNYARKQGHRQGFTEVRIKDITLG